MDLTPYVDNLRHELEVAAEAGGQEARALAERLTAALESSARLTLLSALSAAMSEVTRDLAPGSVDVRLRGHDPEFVVTAPPVTSPQDLDAGQAWSGMAAPAPAAVPDSDDGGAARVNFRLPAHLKARIEDAASQEGLSVNAWLVRAAASALFGALSSGALSSSGLSSGALSSGGWSSGPPMSGAGTPGAQGRAPRRSRHGSEQSFTGWVS